MKISKKIISIITPYCDKIVHGKHIKAYVKGTNKIITVSSTSSDQNYYRQIFRDFRRAGVIIKELK